MEDTTYTSNPKTTDEEREIEFRGIVGNKIYYPEVFTFDSRGISFQCEDGYLHTSKYDEYIGMKDKNANSIFERDITAILNENGKWNHYIVKYGIVRREMATGWIVDIPSFYFDLIRGDFKAFPIVNNYKNKHDLESMVIVGNIYQNIELL